MTRQQKTPAQRAQEALDIAYRARGRLHKRAQTLRSDLAEVEDELRQAEARCEYLAKHPDLPKNGTETATVSTIR